MVRIVNGAVLDLAVPALPGTSFMNTFGKGIFPTDKKIIRYDSRAVAIPTVYDLQKEPNGNN